MSDCFLVVVIDFGIIYFGYVFGMVGDLENDLMKIYVN